MAKKENKKLTKDQAVKKIETLKRDLFNLRFRKINNQVENPAKFNTTRKEIARLFTMKNKKAKWQKKY